MKKIISTRLVVSFYSDELTDDWQAYLNLEASGRELEAIVVGEIQKSYNAYAGILRREADGAYSALEELRTGPIAMPKDHEWNAFVEKDEHFVDPKLPVREAQHISYPGRDNELQACPQSQWKPC